MATDGLQAAMDCGGDPPCPYGHNIARRFVVRETNPMLGTQ
jgi:hypothetical protein